MRQPRRQLAQRAQPTGADELGLELIALAKRAAQRRLDVALSLDQPPGHRADAQVEDDLEHLVDGRRRVAVGHEEGVGEIGEAGHDRRAQAPLPPQPEGGQHDRDVVEAPVDVVEGDVVQIGAVVDEAHRGDDRRRGAHRHP